MDSTTTPDDMDQYSPWLIMETKCRKVAAELRVRTAIYRRYPTKENFKIMKDMERYMSQVVKDMEKVEAESPF